MSFLFPYPSYITISLNLYHYAQIKSCSWTWVNSLWFGMGMGNMRSIVTSLPFQRKYLFPSVLLTTLYLRTIRKRTKKTLPHYLIRILVQKSLNALVNGYSLNPFLDMKALSLTTIRFSHPSLGLML